MDDQSDKISRLEDRIEKLEATTKKMMPTRREALKFGGAAAIGAAAMSGTASAGSAQIGTIGDSNNLVDVEAEDINVSDTINGASVSGAAAGEALTSDGNGALTFASAGGGIPADFTYSEERANRSINTTFTNNTGNALLVIVAFGLNNVEDDFFARFMVGGVPVDYWRPRLEVGDWNDTASFTIKGFVPDGEDYLADIFLANVSLIEWYEAEM